MPLDPRSLKFQQQFSARSENQELYCQELRDPNTHILVALGSTGAGKTLFAVQEALSQLIEGSVNKIMICRPNVSMDEDLGFMPGTEIQKLEPVLKPMLKSIDKLLGHGSWKELVESGLVEPTSFAYMRGDTHEPDAFVIADEMQNATFKQLAGLCERYGGGKMCIMGDPDQVDFKKGHWASGFENCGLAKYARKIEAGAEGTDHMGCVRFTDADIFRHPTVKDVKKVFRGIEAEEQQARGGGSSNYHAGAGRMFDAAIARN